MAKRRTNTETESQVDLAAVEQNTAAELEQSAEQPAVQVEKSAEQPAVQVEKSPAAPANLGVRVYIGPTLPGGRLFQNTVFKDELPAHVAALVEECRALRFLFVNISRLAVARKNLSNQSTVEATKFVEAAKHFSKGAN